MKRKISLSEIKKLGFIIIMVILFRAIMDYIYINIVYPFYQYQYFAQSYSDDYTIVKAIISWLLLIPIPVLVYRNAIKNAFSSQVWTIIICISFIPFTTMYAYNDMKCLGYVILYFCVFELMMDTIPAIRIRMAELSAKILITVIGVVLVVSVWFIWVYYTHCRVQLSIIDVYGIRAEFQTYSMPTLLVYIYSMAMYVIPLYAMYYLYQKKYQMVFLFIVAQYISFCVNGSKGTLFIMLFSLASYFVIEHYDGYLKVIPCGLFFGGVIALLEWFIRGSYYVVSLFFRRMMFLPVLMHNYYYDFFQHNQYDFFKSSISFLGESNYKSIPLVIGENYMESGTSANNGLFSDAWANAGVIGVVIMPILLVLVLKVADGITEDLPMKLYVASAIEVALLYISSSFLTDMLSHGVALMLVVLYLFSKVRVAKDESYEKKNKVKTAT